MTYMIGYFRFYSKYSIKKGVLNFQDIIKICKLNKYLSILISDYFTLSGCIEFYNLCLQNNIKPLIGCEIYIINDIYNKKITGIITVIIKNNAGYKNLCKTINKAWYRYTKKKKLFIKLSELLKLKNIIILLNTNNNSLFKNLITNVTYLLNMLFFFKNHNHNIYIEINQNNINNHNYINKILYISRKSNIKLVVSQPTLYINENNLKSHLIKNTIINKLHLFNEKNKFKINKTNYFLGKKKILSIFKNFFNSLKTTIEITKKCTFILYKKSNTIPILNKKINEDMLLTKIIINNILLCKKINLYKDNKNFIIKRIKKELKIIISMGYSNYFLIVSDFVNWAKKKGIMIGPGRGSSAGSIIAYLLNITEINPLNYDLLFERFLNINKRSMPDFDIDVCKENRDIVIKYIKKKYGNKCVANISTFGKFMIKNTIKDCGRILGLNYNLINNIIKNIGFIPINKLNFQTFIKNNNLINKQIKINRNIREIIKLSLLTEGLIKNLGIHAGGIVISCTNFFNFFPINIIEKNKKYITTQFNKKSIEYIGLMKFDILGLNTLSIIKKILIHIKKNITFKNININDKKTYKLLQNGNTVGVFQLENNKLRNYLKILKPNNLNEIINIIALYRPGPINIFKKYIDINNKNKNNIINKLPKIFSNKIINKKIKKIVNNTKGIIIFQEQIMQIVSKLFNYDLNTADILRQELIKTNSNNLNISNHILYIKKYSKYSTRTTNNILNVIKKFSGYSFNKAHSVSYGLITYFMAYLKANYKLFFFNVHLNYSYENKTKIYNLFNDIKYNKIKIILPNINNCKYLCSIIFPNVIKLGLISIRNAGKKISEYIIKERKKNKYTSFLNFLTRSKKYNINNGFIKNLIYSNLFNNFSKNKNKLIDIMHTYKLKSIYNNKNKCNNLCSNNISKKSNIFFYLKERETIGFFIKSPYKKIKNTLNINSIYKIIYLLNIKQWYIKYYNILLFETNDLKIEQYLIINNINNKNLYPHNFFLIKYYCKKINNTFWNIIYYIKNLDYNKNIN